MNDVQRATALGVFVLLGGMALVSWANQQDNPYTWASEANGAAALLGAAIAFVGVLMTLAGVVALALGKRELTRR